MGSQGEGDDVPNSQEEGQGNQGRDAIKKT